MSSCRSPNLRHDAAREAAVGDKPMRVDLTFEQARNGSVVNALGGLGMVVVGWSCRA
jgi:hypothetical protein